ncbi:hypothetical protein MBLNU230_g5686t1 [Neophaeotheca triangularis]
MKYGKTLRQRSIPAWSHHNIDYDEIKYFIKENTTPGKGKSVSIPGSGDDKLQEVEDALYNIFEEQHLRVDLFVRSKAGEIQRRIEHARKQLHQLSSKNTPPGKRVPVKRLERYGKLENDLLKAGDEIKSLARFISAQRTGFRKLLKKYKKWSGSARLEGRVRADILDQPKSFTKTDLGPLLNDYSETLSSIRSLYEGGLPKVTPNENGVSSSTLPAVNDLTAALEGGSNVDFDTAMSTVPLGENGAFASYLVHPENVVELQIPMLQYSRYFIANKRMQSSNPSSPGIQRKESSGGLAPHTSDYSLLIADDVDDFVREQSALTVHQRETVPGTTRQRAKVCIHSSDEDDPVVSLQEPSGQVKKAGMKRKHLETFFDPSSELDGRRNSEISIAKRKDLLSLREQINDDKQTQPLAVIGSNRSRFVGLGNNQEHTTLATLDTNIRIRKADQDANAQSSISFPFAVLLVRYEGRGASSLLHALNRSHLVERVPGFSLEYHAVYAAHEPKHVSPPFWMSLLHRDIRKLPPSIATKRTSNTSSPARVSSSPSSAVGVTDSTTAVEGTQSSINTEIEAPQLRSFRKKRTRAHAPQEHAHQQQQQYWNEYDNPEDSDQGDAYVIYVDPNERTVFDKIFEPLASLFTRRPKKLNHSAPEEEGLLPRTPTDASPTSSDDETSTTPRRSKHSAPRQPFANNTYGSLPTHASQPYLRSRSKPHAYSSSPFLPHFTAVCLIASLCLLFVAYILVSTGKHKYAAEVDAGVVFAVGSCLLFAVIGFGSLLREKGRVGGIGGKAMGPGGVVVRGEVSWVAWGMATAVVVVDAVGAGGLLAWMLG